MRGTHRVIFAIVIVRHSHLLCSLMAFDYQEIKGLLTYLLTYVLHFDSPSKLFVHEVAFSS